MTVAELETACQQVIDLGLRHITLVSIGPFPRKGWPRGTLLCVNSGDRRVYLFDVDKVMKRIKAKKESSPCTDKTS